MLNPITKPHFINNTSDDIDNGIARKVVSECFVAGEELNIFHDFYVLYGSVVKRVRNRCDTTTKFFMVEGEAKEIFRARNPHYFN